MLSFVVLAGFRLANRWECGLDCAASQLYVIPDYCLDQGGTTPVIRA
jgi:hypothetical protein